jgi:hypothetical protein
MPLLLVDMLPLVLPERLKLGKICSLIPALLMLMQLDH